MIIWLIIIDLITSSSSSRHGRLTSKEPKLWEWGNLFPAHSYRVCWCTKNSSVSSTFRIDSPRCHYSLSLEFVFHRMSSSLCDFYGCFLIRLAGWLGGDSLKWTCHHDHHHVHMMKLLSPFTLAINPPSSSSVHDS